MFTLGIETSCDETSAAVYCDKRGILSNVTFSQIDHHKYFGGVVPEIASRSQLEKIHPIISQALEKAKLALEDIDVIAVANKPGLPGSLLVGLCFAKAIAWAQEKKIVGVNHLEAHAFSPLIEHHVPFPHLCLTASGGHTSLYFIHDLGRYELLGSTQDDAGGEAFDKVAKMLGFGYPGGPIIEQLAREIKFQDICNYPRPKKKSLDFSFSGLKTAVLYDLVNKHAYDMKEKLFLKPADHLLKQEVASSLLVCIADIFTQKLELSLHKYPNAQAITMAGGVACNRYIKDQLTNLCNKRGISFYAPSPQYCTDNAAMIALVGSYKAKQGKFADLSLDIFE